MQLISRLPKVCAFVLVLVGATALFQPAAASPIFTEGLLTQTANILDSGSVLTAVNLGASAPAVTVNGVAFQADNATGLSGFTHGGCTDCFQNQFATGSPLDQLLGALDYTPGATGTLTLSGLTSGNSYLLQLFFSNVVNNTGYNQTITIENQTYALVDFSGPADYLDVQFTADGSSDVVTFGGPNRVVLNAYALEGSGAVPEPASILMLGSGLVGVFAARRRRR
jgi:hypothetical protein